MAQSMNVDPLYLFGLDVPGMKLGNTMFNGSNFIAWSRSVCMVLGAKIKLGSMDGTILKLEENPLDYVRWFICDNVMQCWLLNSMTNGLS